MVSLDDKKLIIRYVESYYRYILIIPIVIVLFIIASYPGYNLMPRYIFSEPYRAPSIIFGSLMFVISLINLKYGIITVFNKKLATKSALWGGLNVIFNKQSLIEGTVIKYRGVSAKILSYITLSIGIILIFIGLN